MITGPSIHHRPKEEGELTLQSQSLNSASGAIQPDYTHSKAFSRDVVASPRCEEEDRSGKVLGRTPSAGRDPLEDLSRPCRVANERRVHLR